MTNFYIHLLLLLLLSHFSRVRLLVTPRTAAHQAPPSMGFSRPGKPKVIVHKGKKRDLLERGLTTLWEKFSLSLPYREEEEAG